MHRLFVRSGLLMSDEGETNWDYFIFSRSISLAGNTFNYAAVIAVRIIGKRHLD